MGQSLRPAQARRSPRASRAGCPGPAHGPTPGQELLPTGVFRDQAPPRAQPEPGSRRPPGRRVLNRTKRRYGCASGHSVQARPRSRSSYESPLAPSMRRRSDEIPALPAVRTARPPATKLAFSILPFVTLTLSASSESLAVSRSRSDWLFLLKNRILSRRPFTACETLS